MICVIAENCDGNILSAHCLGCKAGLAGSHIAGVLFYIEAATQILEKLACTQVNCSWILPTYVNEVPYAKAKDIDFFSDKRIWSKKSLTRELRIYNSPNPSSHTAAFCSGTA